MDPRFYTLAVHSGAKIEPITGAVNIPIFQTSTYAQSSPGKHLGYDYSRAGNPTRTAYEKALAELEGCGHGLAFSSGLAAEQAVIQCLNPGDHILVCDDIYGGTGRLFRQLFSKYGLEFDFLDMSDLEVVSRRFKENTRMVWVETPSNPTLKLVDIRGIANLAKIHKATLVVDNTFASPMFQRPLQLGADIVIHSTTKYIGGHTDLIGGAVMTDDDDLFEKLKFVQFAAGAIPSPQDCYLLHRSIKTLAIRMKQHEINGREVANFLEGHPRVKKVFYPGSKKHPQYALGKEQMSGYPGIVSFDWNGTFEDVIKITKRFKLFTLAESLGGVESLVNHPEQMTHASVPELLRRKLGIGPTLLRLSVGIEYHSDLIADLDQALNI